MIGIYKLTNKVTEQFYIGSSINCSARRRFHFSRLRNKLHFNVKIQESFNQHGEKNFSFEIIHNVEKVHNIDRVLEKLEKQYILKLKPFYNKATFTTRAGGAVKKIKIYKTKKEISIKMSAKTTAYYAGLTEEQKSERNKHKIGRVFTNETRKKLSEKAKQRKWSEEVKRKISQSLTKK